MQLYSSNENYKLYQGNMLDMLEVIEKNSIDSIITDPPYELNFMNKGWDNSGIAFQPDTWKKCYEVLKPGGYLLAFGGSRTFHRIACAIEDAGFEIRDTIMYLYGSGFPKSMSLSKQFEKKNDEENALKWKNWGTALKPSYESIIVARKPFKGSLVDNVIEYGVGGINIDECRVGTGTGEKKKVKYPDIRGDNYNHGHHDYDNTVEYEIEDKGRFPANTILTYDESDFDEVCGGFPNTKGSSNPRKNTNGKVYGDYKTVTTQNDAWGDSGSASRYFINCKYTGKDEEIWKQLLVNNVESNLEILKATKDNIVQMNVEDLLKELKDHYAKYVGNQLDLIETPIVQDIVEMLTWDFKIGTSKVMQDFITNYKKCIQFLNLVQFVEKMDNIDTTQTTQNLLRLFGYVKVAITNYIQGNIEYDQKRYIYTPKASKKDRDCNGTIRNIHPTCKPCTLMQYLVRLVTPNGGTVLDPFNGSGSTGKAVMYENKERNKNYKYIGIELTEEYLPISKARIEYVCNLIEEEKNKEKQMTIFEVR